MEILNDLTKAGSGNEKDKTRNYWEKSLFDSWERLIDKDEQRNLDFFGIKENLLAELDLILEEKEEKKESESKIIESVKESGGKLK